MEEGQGGLFGIPWLWLAIGLAAVVGIWYFFIRGNTSNSTGTPLATFMPGDVTGGGATAGGNTQSGTVPQTTNWWAQFKTQPPSQSPPTSGIGHPLQSSPSQSPPLSVGPRIALVAMKPSDTNWNLGMAANNMSHEPNATVAPPRSGGSPFTINPNAPILATPTPTRGSMPPVSGAVSATRTGIITRTNLS